MYKLIRPLLFATDPEWAHDATVNLSSFLSGSLGKKLLHLLYAFDNKRLHTEVLGIHFRNPVGLAAGFDKNAELIELFNALGFGFIEVGSVTALPSPGNPRPRLFRLPRDHALINHMGLNNDGADKIAEHLKGKKFSIPLGINIAKTNDLEIVGDHAIEDFRYSFTRLYPLAAYLTLNLSCPNSPDGRTFEDKQALNDLLSALRIAEKAFQDRKPLLLKLSPDLSFPELDVLLEIAEAHRIDGYVICNTSVQRKHLRTSQQKVLAIGTGGLSGKPLAERSTELILHVHQQLPNRVVIGAGGIFTARDAREKMKAGASLVQVYTGLVYQGPALAKQIKQGLLIALRKPPRRSAAE